MSVNYLIHMHPLRDRFVYAVRASNPDEAIAAVKNKWHVDNQDEPMPIEIESIDVYPDGQFEPDIDLT